MYRRIDDDYLDPLHFRPDSVLGCAGIVNAARAGNVTIANAPGNGVADDKAIYPYVPAMIEYYLGEEPILANVETYRLEDAEVCEWALDRLDQLVFKPVDGSGGYGLVIGPAAPRRALAELRAKVLERPARLDRAGAGRAVDLADVRRRRRWAPRHLDLRPFAVNDGRDVWVVPGGLTRVALPEGQPRRELEPGRRLEGHVGARRRRTTAASRHGPRARPTSRAPGPPPRHRRSALAGARRAASSTSSDRSSSSNSTEPAVLSRIAESLYWIGRYVERAEDTARLLDVHYHLLLEDRRADEARVCRALLDAMGADAELIGAEPDAATVTALLAYDLTLLRLDRVLDRAPRGRTRVARARRSRRRCGSR